MELIDSDGRLFGVVNVVDALVVLLVLAVLAAGVAFVFADGEDDPEPSSPEIRYATLDVGTQPAYVANQISEGDVVRDGSGDEMTVTDVYVTDEGDQKRVLLRVELKSPQTEGSFSFDGSPPRVNRELSVATDEYKTTGRITAVSETNPDLDLVNRTVVLRTKVSAENAAQLSVGDEYRVNGQTVATVQSVDAYGTGNPERRLVYVGVTYVTYEPRAEPQFAGRVVREGAKLPFRTSEFEFQGRVVREDAIEQRGEETTRTVTMEIEGAQPDVVDGLEPGMHERVKGETIAVVENVSVEPAKVVLTSDDGNVYLREHPVKKDVSITAEIQVRESVSGVTFKGDPIRPGDEILIDLGTITIRATVTSL